MQNATSTLSCSDSMIIGPWKSRGQYRQSATQHSANIRKNGAWLICNATSKITAQISGALPLMNTVSLRLWPEAKRLGLHIVYVE